MLYTPYYTALDFLSSDPLPAYPILHEKQRERPTFSIEIAEKYKEKKNNVSGTEGQSQTPAMLHDELETNPELRIQAERSMPWHDMYKSNTFTTYTYIYLPSILSHSHTHTLSLSLQHLPDNLRRLLIRLKQLLTLLPLGFDRIILIKQLLKQILLI
jgi:hypothetical protein